MEFGVCGEGADVFIEEDHDVHRFVGRDRFGLLEEGFGINGEGGLGLGARGGTCRHKKKKEEPKHP